MTKLELAQSDGDLVRSMFERLLAAGVPMRTTYAGRQAARPWTVEDFLGAVMAQGCFYYEGK